MADAAIGHNSALTSDQKSKLQGIIQEVEGFDAEARDIAANRRAAYKAAKEAGFDTKAIKAVVQLRRMEAQKRELFENTVDTYRHALGMLAELPLGRAAIVSAVEKATGKGKPPMAELPQADVSDPPFAVPSEEPKSAA